MDKIVPKAIPKYWVFLKKRDITDKKNIKNIGIKNLPKSFPTYREILKNIGKQKGTPKNIKKQQ